MVRAIFVAEGEANVGASMMRIGVPFKRGSIRATIRDL